MHADFHELSQVAAGWRAASEHLRSCPACRSELARILAVREGLAALPSFPAPDGAWQGARGRAGGRPILKLPLRLAMAASLLVVIATAIVLTRPPAGTEVAGPTAPVPAPLDELVAENARLEAVLAGLPRTRTARVGTAYTVATLEDRLAMLDDRITTVALEPHAPEMAEDLWRERVTLMNSLVQVQYANAVASR